MTQSERILRVLIVDDEKIARQYIRKLLGQRSGFEVIGESRRVSEAFEAIAKDKPDLVLLDMQMPGEIGLNLIEKIGTNKMPATVFVTAFRDYAVRAFECYAVGYLLKPFTPDQFWHAVDRAKDLIISGKQAARFREMLAEALADFGRLNAFSTNPQDTLTGTEIVVSAGKEKYITRVVVPGIHKSDVVLMRDVSWFSVDGCYTEIHQASKSHLARNSLDWFEKHLDPAEFLRIHRSIIVNVGCIVSIDRSVTGQVKAVLNSRQQLPVSRRKRATLLALLRNKGKL